MKNYIEISKKRDIANKVLVMCMSNMDGFVKIDLFKKNIYTAVYAAKEYMNIKADEDFESVMKKYDDLSKNGKMETLINLEDYHILCNIVDDAVIMIEKENSVEHSVAQMCNSIVAAMGKISDAIENKINEFDTDILQDTNIAELMSIVQKFK